MKLYWCTFWKKKSLLIKNHHNDIISHHSLLLIGINPQGLLNHESILSTIYYFSKVLNTVKNGQAPVIWQYTNDFIFVKSFTKLDIHISITHLIKNIYLYN